MSNTNTNVKQQQQPSTSKVMTCPSSLTEEKRNIFAFDDIIVTASEETGTDTRDIEPMLYLESLETRVHKALDASKGFTDLVTIAEAYGDDKSINIRLKNTPMSSDEFEAFISGMERMSMASIETPLGEFHVPIPTALPKYQKVLNTVAAASIKTLNDLSLLTEQNSIDINQTVAKVTKICKEAVTKHAKTIQRKDIMESILSVMMIERVKYRYLANLCDV